MQRKQNSYSKQGVICMCKYHSELKVLLHCISGLVDLKKNLSSSSSRLVYFRKKYTCKYEKREVIELINAVWR